MKCIYFHLFSLFLVVFISHYILLICVIPFSSLIVPLALDQTPLVLALVALLAFDHSDGETISVIRVLA